MTIKIKDLACSKEETKRMVNSMVPLSIIVGYIINLGIASCVHFIAYFMATNHRADIVLTDFFILPKSIYSAIKFILSPDYWSASSFKKNYLSDNKKYNLGKFILKSNFINLIVSVIFFLIICFKGNNKLFLMAFIFRAVSRAFEIIIAFYKDVAYNNEKKSNLKSEDRLKLATKSYFEIILNFTIVYYMLKLPLQNGIYKCITDTYNIFDYLFLSIGISTFTSVKFDYCNLYNILISIQLFASLSLVYFALAKYISEIKS